MIRLHRYAGHYHHPIILKCIVTKLLFFSPGGHFITSPRARDWVGGTKVVPGATQLHTEDPGPGPNMVRYLYSIMESDADKVVSYLDEKYSRPRILTAWARCCDTIRLL